MDNEIKTVENTAIMDIPSQAVTPMDMLQLAIGKGAELEQLEKFMDLAERWQKGEAKKLYVTAMAKFREEAPEIERTKKGHNSKYAGLAESLASIKECLANNGLSHSWKTDQNEKLIRVTCEVTHTAGHSEKTSLEAYPDDSGKKNAIQSIGSTVSYLQRYTLFSLLGLASKEMDNDGGAPIEVINEELANTIHATLTENEIPMDGFMAWLKKDIKVESIEAIPLKSYIIVNKRIRSAIRAKKNDNS